MSNPTRRSSPDRGCFCNVKRRSLFGLLHFQTGAHVDNCPKATPLDHLANELIRK